MSVGLGADGKLNSFIRVELNDEGYLVGTEVLERFRPRVILQSTPSRMFSDLSVDCSFGEDVDFANARTGHGISITGAGTVRTGNHLELRAYVQGRALNVKDPVLGSGRLFTAQVERLRATWTFSSRAFTRLIGQYTQTTRDPGLYAFAVSSKGANASGSALLAYKLNWQTVFYLGYGDQHDYYSVSDNLQPMSQQFFAKASYAIQR